MKALRFYLLFILFFPATVSAQKKTMFLSDATATSGDSATVELSIHTTDDIRGLQLDLEYDTTHLSFGRVIPFEIINNFTLSTNETVKGKLKIVVLSFSGQKIEKGLIKLFSIKFKVDEETSFSHTKINISNPVLSKENGNSIIPTVFPGYIINNEQNYLTINRTDSSWYLNLVNVVEYAALQFTINYDTNKVNIDSAKSLSRVQNFNFNYNQPNKGKVNIVINSFTNTLLGKDEGFICQLFFTEKDLSHNIGDFSFSEAIGSDLNSTVTQIITLDSYYISSIPVIDNISNVSIEEDNIHKIKLSARGLVDDQITFNAKSSEISVAATVSNDTLTLTPDSNWNGTSIITAYASDVNGKDSTTFTLTVIAVNDAPVMTAVANDTILEDSDGKVIKLSASDIEGDTLIYLAFSDTLGLTVSVSNDTIKLKPVPDYFGTSKVTTVVSDGEINDSSTFSFTVLNVQDKPYPFEWVSTSLDTIHITKENIASNYILEWTESKEVDNEIVDYLLFAQIGVYGKEEILDTISTKYPIPYSDILEGVFEDQPINAATVRFSIKATDGIDTIDVTGEDRVLYVNRYEYLSTLGEGIPTEFALHENYPNPFNPSTTLRFDLPELSDVNVIIYNMLGQKVKTFNMQSTPAGYHTIKWDATNDYGDPVGAGVYLYQLQANQFVKTRKMILLK